MADAATHHLIASMDLVGLQTSGNQAPVDVFHLKLRDVTVAGTASESGHDTAVAFDYRTFDEEIKTQNADGTFTSNLVANDVGSRPINAVDHDALAASAHDHADATNLTYLVHIDGSTAIRRLRGYENYTAVDAFTFEALSNLATGATNATYDPLTLDLHEFSPAIATLMADAATHHLIASMDLVGLQTSGNQAPVDVFHLKLRDVTVAGTASESGHDTAVAFDYRTFDEEIKTQNADGRSPAIWLRMTWVAAPSTLSITMRSRLRRMDHADATNLTYLVHIDGIHGDSKIAGYEIIPRSMPTPSRR